MSATYLKIRPLYPINGWGNGELRQRSYLLGSFAGIVIVSIPYLVGENWRLGISAAIGAVVGLGLAGPMDSADPHTTTFKQRLRLEWKTDWGATVAAAALGFGAMLFCMLGGIAAMALVAPDFLKGTDGKPLGLLPSAIFLAVCAVAAMMCDQGANLRSWLRSFLIVGPWVVTDASREHVPGPPAPTESAADETLR